MTGTGVSSSLSAPKSYEITVTAKDASGNNIGHGGDIFFIEITNKWILDIGNNWVSTTGTKQVLSSPIYDKFSDNGDGTYSYTYTVSLDGAITIVIKLATANGLNWVWLNNNSWSGSPYLTNTLSNLEFYNYASTGFISGINESFTGILTSLLLSPKSETFTFYVTHDDGVKILLNSVVKVDKQTYSCACSSTFTATLTSNTYYSLVIYYFQDTGPLGITIEWESPSVTRQIIPSSQYFTTENVGSSPFQISINCLDGYTSSDPSSPTMWVSIWGDGKKVGAEVWDDGNSQNGDGCKGDWSSIETGYVWSGGSSTSKDIWTKCTNGYYQNSSKDKCVSKCGDGLRISEEKWDDGNSQNGDGCKGDWSLIETGYVWSGGSSTSKDVWSKWGRGFYQNDSSNPSICITKWGDGIRAELEMCDDGNVVSGDGWAGDWSKIEDGWVWVGSYFGLTDICLQWDPGYGSDPDYTQCIGSDVPRNVQSLAVASSVAAYSGVSTNLVVTGFSSSSSASSNSFGMINQIQLVIILPLIGAFLPLKIFDYLKSMKTSMFNLSFLPTNNSEGMINIKSWFDFKQSNSYLNLLDLNSGSAFANILTLTTTVWMVVGIHIVFLILYVILRKTNRLIKV